LHRIKLLAPAKINLTLDVTGKRPDGYHELITTMHQVNLADVVWLQAKPSGIVLRHNLPALSHSADNLAYRAAQMLLDYAGMQTGVAITLEKRIPLSAGLAGGSTDAAAVLLGMNRLFALGLSREVLCRIGSDIGSDVPFCLWGGTAHCTGRGEQIQDMPEARPLFFVLVTPQLRISTAAVFSAFRPEAVKERPDEAGFQRAWRQGELRAMADCMGNVLESVSARAWPQIGAVKRQMENLGALCAVMSGSGPTVFGLFSDEVRAKAASRQLQTWHRNVYVCRSHAASHT
jgi:4-diphosphocytidyl-2-C-methyl-D-erythritol kinase